MLHTAHVSHHLPGRLRLKVPRAKGDPLWFRRLQQALVGLPVSRAAQAQAGAALRQLEAPRALRSRKR